MPGNENCYKAVTSCQKKDVPVSQEKLDQKLSKGGTEFVQTWDSCCMP